MDRNNIADFIVERLEGEADRIASTYQNSEDKIGYFVVDDLLPEDLAIDIFNCFPEPKDMRLKKSLRENKYIAAQMNRYNPILEESIYAFHDKRIVELISKICNIPSLYPDENLYAGGISLMEDKQFLNPHLDNSHDKDRNKWRVLNLLYYITPNWSAENGGNLELWPNGPKNKSVVIHSKFNRLAVMSTHNTSWHSVSPVSSKANPRCCVSNYYFSNAPLKNTDQFHVTSFRGRPDQKARDFVLFTDIKARMMIRKIFKKGIVENKHVYKK